MVVDDVVAPRDLRQTLITRFAFYESKREKKSADENLSDVTEVPNVRRVLQKIT